MTLYIVMGPVAGGKTTWVKNHAKPGDITIELDAIAATLTPDMPPHDPPKHVADVAIIARQAAINAALRWSSRQDVYIIHSAPTFKHLALYRRYGAEFITVDPGKDICLARGRTERPARLLPVIEDWYANWQPRMPITFVKAAW